MDPIQQQNEVRFCGQATLQGGLTAAPHAAWLWCLVLQAWPDKEGPRDLNSDCQSTTTRPDRTKDRLQQEAVQEAQVARAASGDDRQRATGAARLGPYDIFLAAGLPDPSQTALTVQCACYVCMAEMSLLYQASVIVVP